MASKYQDGWPYNSSIHYPPLKNSVHPQVLASHQTRSRFNGGGKRQPIKYHTVGGCQHIFVERQRCESLTRRKQRHRCARLPVWRGRGSTERGAPVDRSYRTEGEFNSILASPFGTLRLLDHLIRSRQHIRRDRETDLLRCFQVDDQLKLRGLLDRRSAGLG